MVKVFRSIEKWREFRKSEVFRNKTIGFVPTMGNLHKGHESLLVRSVVENQVTILSIFVNPTQFDDKQDLEKYPRTEKVDLEMAERAEVDYALIPDYKEMYPDNYVYKVTESEVSKIMEGASRKGHFDGVLTVVLKLLMLTQSHRAYFGEKDFQQLKLIQEMAKAFFINTEIIGCQIIRDENGVALSSRNSRLSKVEYELAKNFPKILGNSKSCEDAVKDLEKIGLIVDYVRESWGRKFGAVKVGEVRLIDNKLQSE